MKRNIAIGIFLIGAATLSSCSTTKLASTETSDDVYFSKAKAGDEPIYAAVDNYNPNAAQDQGYSDDDDDYFYYDDYASRINRFNYYSPFSYYDNLYYGYNNYAFNNGFSLGFNYGPFGYGYSPYGYGYGGGWGYGYGGWGLGYGLGYGYGGLGWGYGGYGGGFWGGGYYGGGYYGGGGYFSSGTPRPNRGTGNPYGRGTRPTSPSSTGIGYIPGGRGVRTDGNSSSNSYARPARTDARPSRSDAQPVRQQPASVDRTSVSPPSSSGGSRSSGGGGGGGGGGRPVRP